MTIRSLISKVLRSSGYDTPSKTLLGLKGFRVFILINFLISLIALAIFVLSASQVDMPTNTSKRLPIEHRSIDWYSVHTSSDGRKIPLNKTITGVFIEKLYDINLAKGTFRAKGYVWTKWYGALKGWDLKSWKKQDPLDGFYMNSTNKHDATFDGEGYTYKSDHGWNYTYRMFDSEFESSYRFNKYPFDSQVVNIYVFHDTDAAVLRTYIDRDSSTQENADSFKEYSMTRNAFSDLVYEYPTRFGFTDYDQNEKQNYSVSAIKAEIHLRKSIGSGFGKEILPPLLVSLLLLVNTVAPKDNWEEMKAAVPPAVFLSLIFLQQGYRTNLPALNYLTFIDVYYLLLYILTIYMSVEVIVQNLPGFRSLGITLKLFNQVAYLVLGIIAPLIVLVFI